jgi:hypothetical protein
MVQTSVQFTPVQVLQAARRAEAEGKMDYALQFYRHLVEQHGGTPEAQEAREGLFRIAEWRWGEARVARTREGTPSGAQPAQSQPTPPSTGQQRVYNVANNPPQGYASEPQAAAAGALPQIISRQHAQAAEVPAFHARFRISKFFAHALSSIGWVILLSGIVAAAAGIAGTVAELSAIVLLGAPFGVMLGVPAALFGLMLVVSGQLAAALFDSANATLEMAAIERGRTSF